MLYMRPNLILVSGGFEIALVLGLDPTSGTFWTQEVGSGDEACSNILQQRGSSQVLVGSDGVLVLANVKKEKGGALKMQ